MFKTIENAVAISAAFHSDARYQGFYDALPSNWNGFTGIWSHVADYAEAFSDIEAGLGANVWDNRDWIVCIDKTVDLIYENGYASLGRDELKKQIQDVFEDSFE